MSCIETDQGTFCYWLQREPAGDHLRGSCLYAPVITGRSMIFCRQWLCWHPRMLHHIASGAAALQDAIECQSCMCFTVMVAGLTFVLQDVVWQVPTTRAYTCAHLQDVIEEMSKHVDRPLIFPLSNPTDKAEITAEDAYEWSQGKGVVASGGHCSAQCGARWYVECRPGK